jgi:hypothetical protein
MLRKIQKILLIIFLIFPILSYCEEKPTAAVFFSPTCKACMKVRMEILPGLKERYKGKLHWLELSIAEPDNLKMLNSLSEEFGKKKALVPAVFIGDTFLVGFPEIEKNIELAIQNALGTKTKLPQGIFKRDLLDIFKRISILAVITSGLIDGVNPCAFAVIVFFISFLAVYGYKKREIVYVGIFYCWAVFLTYLLLGVGFFKFLYSFSQMYFVIKYFYYLVAFFCFLMGMLAVYDYFKFRKTKNSDEAILQLPKFLKKRINITIGSRMREKKGFNAWGLVATSSMVGFLVSLLEAACTGQVYVPTIVFILKNTNLRLKAATYLVIYNLMFILPLVVIFLLSLFGVSSAKFNNFLKRNVGKIKIFMAFIFFILGAFILGLS